LGQTGDQGQRLVDDLPPGDPEHAEATGREVGIASAVALEAAREEWNA
jgi:hypothetical protein